MENVLTLWDIDGTLVNVFKYHTPAYQMAIKKVMGVDVPLVDISKNYGKPSALTIYLTLKEKGVSEKDIEGNVELILEVYAKQLLENLKNETEDVALPGVRDMLDELRLRKVPMGIVTGNIEIAGKAILKATGMEKYFDVQSFGDNKDHRKEIVQEAMNSAKEQGLLMEDTKIFVFGDTPSDVEAAKQNGCVSVAVVRDAVDCDEEHISKRRKELQESQPDYILEDFSDISKVLALLGFS